MKLLVPVLAAMTLLAAPAATAEYQGVTQIRYANAYCESSGNIHAIGWHGVYRGKWQFDQTTWDAFAPWRWKGRDPAWAPEWVQDWTAMHVSYDAWPRC